MNTGYLALEIRRALRAPGTMLFTIGFPAVFYLLEMTLYRDVAGSAGSDFAVTVMVSLMAWGVMTAGLMIGTRVVHERTSGWQRQLRLTPLSGGGFLTGKVAVGMGVALPTALAVPIVAAVVQGVSLPPLNWAYAILLVWLGSLPFAILGLLIGQVATKDTVQNYVIVGMLVLATFGGLFIPLETLPEWWAQFAHLLPSYWLAEAGKAGALPGHDLVTALLVLAGWSAVLAAAVVWRYRHDSART